MDSESFAFGAPVIGVLVGAVIIVVSLFQGGLTPVTMIGGLIGFVSIVGLTIAVTRFERGELSGSELTADREH